MTAVRALGNWGGRARISSMRWSDRAPINRGPRKIEDCLGYSSVHVSQHGVGGPDDRHQVGDHVVHRHPLERLKVHKRRSTELDTPRLVSAVAHDVAPVLA